MQTHSCAILNKMEGHLSNAEPDVGNQLMLDFDSVLFLWLRS